MCTDRHFITLGERAVPGGRQRLHAGAGRVTLPRLCLTWPPGASLMNNTVKHLIDWKHWTDDEVRRVLALAYRIKHHRWEYQGTMQGRTLVMIFQKTSTRTRVSFEAGMTELGGHAINLDWLASNFTLSDVRYEARYLSRNAAFIMARLKENAELLRIAEGATVPVINGCCNL